MVTPGISLTSYAVIVPDGYPTGIEIQYVTGTEWQCSRLPSGIPVETQTISFGQDTG